MSNRLFISLTGNSNTCMKPEHINGGKQGSTCYDLFEYVYAVPGDIGPFYTKSKLNVVLEYPYPIEKLGGYLDIQQYKDITTKEVVKQFPNATNVEFTVQNQKAYYELTAFIQEQDLLKENKGSNDESLTYRYAIHFHEIYVIPKNCNCSMHVIVPEGMADALNTNNAWDDFTRQLGLHLQMNLGAYYSEMKFSSTKRAGKDQFEHTIHIPVNHVVNEEHRLALDYLMDRARVTKEFDLGILKFIKDNAVTPATRREATLIQPKGLEGKFTCTKLSDAEGEYDHVIQSEVKESQEPKQFTLRHNRLEGHEDYVVETFEGRNTMSVSITNTGSFFNGFYLSVRAKPFDIISGTYCTVTDCDKGREIIGYILGPSKTKTFSYKVAYDRIISWEVTLQHAAGDNSMFFYTIKS